MQVSFGINTGFALNRYTSPEQWVPFVREVLGLRRVQITADLLHAGLPDELLWRLVDSTRGMLTRYGVEVTSAFTSAFTRVNHFSHPDADVREYWVSWFKRFVDISAALGAHALGSHLGILTVADLHDPAQRQRRFVDTLSCWRRIAEYGAQKGLRFLTWEPMSIPREYGETIAEVARIQEALQEDMAIPMYLCLDVDHGDVASPLVQDTDPYAYMTKLGPDVRQLHLKQSYRDKGGHWPFTEEHNARGRITPARVLRALEEGGATEVELLLELSFRERAPQEASMVADLVASVDYWRPFCPQ